MVISIELMFNFRSNLAYLYRLASLTIWYVSTPSAVIVISSAIKNKNKKKLGYQKNVQFF